MYATEYPRLRASLAPEYAEIDDEQLDALVAEIYGPGVGAEDVEAFWSDVGRGFQNVARGVGRVAQKAAPVVAGALPSIAQGAMTGATVAGPWGALAGAVAGGVGGVMSQSKNRTLRSVGGAIGGATQLAGSLTGGGALRNLAGVGLGGGTAGMLGQLAGGALRGLPRGGAARLARRAARQPVAGGTAAAGRLAGGIAQQLGGALAAPGGSANALLGMLARPETLRALSASALGGFGRQQVPIGGQQVPVQSILGALGTLAERAAAESEAAGEHAHPAHYYDAAGELAIDPADAEQRAEALLELYAATATPYSEWLVGEALEAVEAAEHEETDGPEYTEQDAEYDEWLLANEQAWDEAEQAEHDYGEHGYGEPGHSHSHLHATGAYGQEHRHA